MRTDTTAEVWKTYFDFLAYDDIRIKGTRVGIETVLDDYLQGASPEEIAVRYRTLSLEQIYATITYYLHDTEETDRYLQQWRAHAESSWETQQRNPSPAVQRLRELKARRLQQSKSKTA